MRHHDPTRSNRALRNRVRVRPVGWIAALALATAFALPEPTAHAARPITRAAAERTALAGLSAQTGAARVVVWERTAVMAKGSWIAQAGPDHGATLTPTSEGGNPVLQTTSKAQRLENDGWLFWADLAPGAMFSHPSVLVVVDSVTGKIAQRHELVWQPLLDGARITFDRMLLQRPIAAKSAKAAKAAKTATGAKGANAAAAKNTTADGESGASGGRFGAAVAGIGTRTGRPRRRWRSQAYTKALARDRSRPTSRPSCCHTRPSRASSSGTVAPSSRRSTSSTATSSRTF